MSIKSLYREYFQKSRIFLYPALEIKRGGNSPSSITPIETYISWNDTILPKDRRLICLYHLRNDPQYKQFEKTRLFGNKLFEDFREVEGDKAIYIFNFEQNNSDWNNFLEGRYSHISTDLKKKILTFYRDSNSNSIYVDSFINPNKYYDLYAELLGVDIKILKEVEELCSRPDIIKETLILKEKSLIINKLHNNSLK